jgi:PGF-pre-PGF domain-containing protein
MNPEENFTGINYITFYAFDPENGYSSSNEVTLNVTPVNDAPSRISDIANITWPEDTVYSSLDLSPYFEDVDGDDLNYSSSIVQNILVTIDNNTGVATLTPDDNFTGIEYVIFYAWDKDNLYTSSNSITLNVSSVNDVPYWNKTIPVQQIIEDNGTVSDLNLSIFALDYETNVNELTYYIDYEDLTMVDCEIHDSQILNLTPAANYSGTMEAYCNLTIFDGTDNSSAVQIFVNVTNLFDPVIFNFSNPIPNMTWEEDTVYVDAFNLDDHFINPDRADLNYTWSGVSNISINVSANKSVNFSQPANWYGIEYIVFTANQSNTTASSNQVKLTVSDVAEPSNQETTTQTGGGGGGGGGGGMGRILKEDPAGEDKKSVSFENIAAGESVDILIDDIASSVSRISFIPKRTLSGVKTTYMRIEKNNVSVALEDDAYEYFNLESENISYLDISEIKVWFQVEKEWLIERNASDDSVGIAYHDDEAGEWRWLAANRESTTEDLVFYTSNVTRFGLFAIGVNEKTAEVVETEDKPVEEEREIETEYELFRPDTNRYILLDVFDFFLILLSTASVIVYSIHSHGDLKAKLKKKQILQHVGETVDRVNTLILDKRYDEAEKTYLNLQKEYHDWPKDIKKKVYQECKDIHFKLEIITGVINKISYYIHENRFEEAEELYKKLKSNYDKLPKQLKREIYQQAKSLHEKLKK